MFEAFFQLQKRMMLMNALHPDKNNPVDMESLSGKARLDEWHLKRAERFYKEKSGNESS